MNEPDRYQQQIKTVMNKLQDSKNSTWAELSVGFMLTSSGSFFMSAADLTVLVFWYRGV